MTTPNASPRPSQAPFDLSRLWPLLLIAVGVVWLLAATGILSGRGLAILLSYSPLLLIGIGLDVVWGRHTRYRLPYTALAAGLLLLLLLIGPALGLYRGPEVATERFSEPMAGTASARIVLDLASAPSEVFATQTRAVLIDAETTDVGTVRFDVRGDRDKVVRLSRDLPAGITGFGAAIFERLEWKVGLSPTVPLALDVDVGSGPTVLRLAELELTELALRGGSGGVQMTLPAARSRYPVQIDGASGPMTVTVADGAVLDLRVDVASGPFSLDLGRELDLRLELSGGSGPTTIDVPSGTAVRLDARDDGSGPLTVHGSLQRVSGSDDLGVWQTRDFETAAQRVEIIVRDAGSGPIAIR